MVLNFKSNKNLIANKSSNSFGDQIIQIIDLSKKPTAEQKKKDPYLVGKIIKEIINYEGSWITFTEKELLKYL